MPVPGSSVRKRRCWTVRVGEGGGRGRRRRGTCRCTSAGRATAVCRGGTSCRWCTSTTPCSGSCCGRRRWSSGSTTPAASPSPAPPPSSSASGRAFPTPARGFTENIYFCIIIIII
ncbi:Auxin responsive protein [Musa troglodytarum]|uniref:Auxin responsive protein n=1 Tax=Musa troglodytarum TaxID=320322 RepID=A0A9E7FVZ1_9LILI|nr:Auxin responsive protein [Musa troglodytarum]